MLMDWCKPLKGSNNEDIISGLYCNIFSALSQLLQFRQGVCNLEHCPAYFELTTGANPIKEQFTVPTNFRGDPTHSHSFGVMIGWVVLLTSISNTLYTFIDVTSIPFIL